MNIYDAIMKAADHIENNPDIFRFSETQIPRNCGTPGCALGWIGYFAGAKPVGAYLGISRVAYNSIGGPDCYFSAGSVLGRDVSQIGFYDRLDALVGNGWANKAPLCAKALRMYAKKYHAQPREEVVSWGDVVWRPRELA